MLTGAPLRADRSTRRLTASPRALRLLGGTALDASTAELLLAARHSKRLLLLRGFLDATRRPEGGVGELWALLEAAEREAPQAVHTVLQHPTVGAWAEQTLRLLHTPRPEAPADLARFGAVVAAAALRAGLSFSVTVRSDARLLSLPSLGALRRDRPGTFAVTEKSWQPEAGRPDVLPLHRLAGSAVLLDDLDPYRAPRASDRVRPARRLGPRGHHDWDRRLTGALELMRRVDPARAAEVEALVLCVVPLARTSRSAAATAPAAHGALLLRPRPRADLAASLVHEVQHGKLAALGDLVRLHTADPEPRHRVPWRPDLRPFEGLLQGAYAHLALADWWQRAALAGLPGAWARHSHYRAQVAAVLPVLTGSAHLTEEGRKFVDAMAAKERGDQEEALKNRHIHHKRPY